VPLAPYSRSLGSKSGSRIASLHVTSAPSTRASEADQSLPWRRRFQGRERVRSRPTRPESSAFLRPTLGYLPSRSRMRNLTRARLPASSMSIRRFRTACVTQACGVRGCAENAHAPTGMVNSGENVLAYAGQRDGLDEIHRQDHLGLRAQELGPRDGRSVWRRVDASSFEDLLHGRRSDRDTEEGGVLRGCVDSPTRSSWPPDAGQGGGSMPRCADALAFDAGSHGRGDASSSHDAIAAPCPVGCQN
jgi:hypothetical protein